MNFFYKNTCFFCQKNRHVEMLTNMIPSVCLWEDRPFKGLLTSCLEGVGGDEFECNALQVGRMEGREGT